MNLLIKYNILIIGSYSLPRNSKDIDLICSESEALKIIKELNLNITKQDEYIISTKEKVEFLLYDKQLSLKIVYDQHNNIKKIASYDTLLTIKLGHIHRPNQDWEKHMNDIIWLKENIQTVFKDKIKRTNTLVKLHTKCTDERLGNQKLPKLNKSKNEFFDDNVIKYIDHDEIHKIVAQDENPGYTYMQKKNDEVFCSLDLWNKLSYQKQLNCVFEESLVIAIERHLLPSILGDKIRIINSEKAFKWALMRICTDLTSGWFRDFAIDNYKSVLDMFSEEKINHYIIQILKKQNR